MTYIIDDELLGTLVAQCLARADELGMKFVAISTSDGPPQPETNVPTKHYSSIGNFPLADSNLLSTHVDFSNDIYDIMGHERAVLLLHSHSVALQNTMWMELDRVRRSAS